MSERFRKDAEYKESERISGQFQGEEAVLLERMVHKCRHNYLAVGAYVVQHHMDKNRKRGASR